MSTNPVLIAWACVWRCNHLLQRGAIAQALEAADEGFRSALAAGAAQSAVGPAKTLARLQLATGLLQESGEVIREGLCLSGVPAGRAGIRLDAALLSTRRGDLAAAKMHLERAKELISNLDTRPGLMAPPILAEYLLANHQPEHALDMLERTLPAQAVDPRIADEMLMWAARSAADIAQDARDRRDPARATAANERLADLIALRNDLPHSAFDVVIPDDPVQPAIEALFNAEKARCVYARPAAAAAAWQDAVDRCAAASLHWEQQIASWRLVQAQLDDGAPAATVAATLRDIHRFAESTEAKPLQRETTALASIAKISLDEPPAQTKPDTRPAPFDTLTNREAEILGHLLVGRTYTEIAAALFISQKTVSVHVSNLLRKTGTSSRRDVAALATRVGYSELPLSQTSDRR
jgi:DNA-binding CsgD family transcriptional regulator